MGGLGLGAVDVHLELVRHLFWQGDVEQTRLAFRGCAVAVKSRYRGPVDRDVVVVTGDAQRTEGDDHC